MDHGLPFTDLHCHLLPGIDDGPRNWETSLAMARLAVAEGISAIVATPHQLGRYEGNTREQILDLTAEAQERINHAKLPLTILPGADVRVREDLPQLVRNRQVLTLADRLFHLLVELPHDQVIPLDHLIYQLHMQRVNCILSHPERNGHLQRNPERLRPWVQQGCLVQVTSGSITGHFGPEARELSRWLFRENMVHLVATDAHDVTHRPPLLRQAFKSVCRWVGIPRAEKVFVTNPKAVILGEAIHAPLPISSPRRGIASWWKVALAS
jgi:protein-tyrosine phosphatase